MIAQITEKKARLTIAIASVAVFALVATLKLLPQASSTPSFVSFLPLLNAILNGTCAVLLIASLMAIKSRNIGLHKMLNTTALLLSIVFLLSYVLFHYFVPDARYGDIDHDGILSDAEKTAAGSMRLVYLPILILHITFAAIVLPLVLFSYYRGVRMEVQLHKKLVRWTYPIWLYVTVSGVIVYLMIKPYYPF